MGVINNDMRFIFVIAVECDGNFIGLK